MISQNEPIGSRSGERRPAQEESQRTDRATDSVVILHDGQFRELSGPLATKVLTLWNQPPHGELESAVPKGGAS